MKKLTLIFALLISTNLFAEKKLGPDAIHVDCEAKTDISYSQNDVDFGNEEKDKERRKEKRQI